MGVVQYLNRDAEKMPQWLSNFKPGQNINILEMLKTSRILFNPGAGTECEPIELMFRSGAVHLYVGVDYYFPKDKIINSFTDRQFPDYIMIHEQELIPSQLSVSGIKSHFTIAEVKQLSEMFKANNFSNVGDGFAILKIFEKKNNNAFGAERFAILYIGADVYPTYDVLFGNIKANPYMVIVQEYGFGGGYTGSYFAYGSPLELIANRTILPKYLLCADYTHPWDGYVWIPDAGFVQHGANRGLCIRDEKISDAEQRFNIENREWHF